MDEDIGSSVVVGGPEELVEHLLVVLDLELALLDLLLGALDVLLLAAQPPLQTADLLVELALGDEALLGCGPELLEAAVVEGQLFLALLVELCIARMLPLSFCSYSVHLLSYFSRSCSTFLLKSLMSFSRSALPSSFSLRHARSCYFLSLFISFSRLRISG